MDQIRPWLFIGKYRDTLNYRLLSVNGIKAMLQLAEPVTQPNITSVFLSVEDFAPIPSNLLRQGVDFIKTQKNLERPILVACGAGINRSTAFCVAALHEEEEMGLLQAFRAVKQKHSIALPHPPVWESLCKYYQETVPIEELFG